MIQHFRSFLGNVSDVWKDNEGSHLEVLLFKDQPQPGISTYTTLNMSEDILSLKGEKKIRQELIFSVYEKFENEEIAQHLVSFAEEVVKSRKGLLKGQVIGPGRPFIVGTELVGLYPTAPVFFESGFHVNNNYHPPVVVVWLIPILINEIHFIQKKGWNEFEERLEKSQCDFWNVNRKSII
jgi:hypothetical protein